jgi:acyl-CoA synthetase (AMP-forming)/AMP-acid ligase II
VANIAEILDGPAQHDPERAALVIEDGTVWSFGELHAEVVAWATTLSSAGVQPGDRIALADWGGARSTAVTLGAAQLGAAAAHMNPLLTESELAQLVDASLCLPIGVADAQARERLEAALGPDATTFDAAVPAGAIPARAAGGERDALVLFTSGTTGLPKPVPISHDSVMARIAGYRQPFALDRPAAVALMCVPSFHVGGILGLLFSLYGGDTTVIQPRFDAGRWLALVARHRVASAFVVPTMLARILDHPDVDSTDASSLVRLSYGAAPAPPSLIRRAMARWPDVELSNVFGQTETLGAYTALSAVDHRDPKRIGSVGRAMPGVELRIVDPASDREVPTGEVGELWVRSSQNVEAGWLQTGDLAYRDADGFVFPQGRRGDLINRGGEKFAPTEVAEALCSHPAIRDAAVAGIPDDEMGMRVGALLVLEPKAAPPSLEELRAWTRDRVAPFKLPEIVAFVDALPANELGKLPARDIVDLIESNVGSPT